MPLGKISNSFNLTMERGVRLTPGEIITVRVLNRIYGKKWAISIGGKVYRALSNLDLVPNKLLKARVVLEEGQVVLKLLDSGSSFETTENILIRLGLPRDEITKEIVKTLLRTNLPINEYIIAGIKKTLTKLKNVPPARVIKLLTLFIDKNIDISKSQIIPLIAVLDNSYSEQHKQKGKKEEREKQKKENITIDDGEESLEEIKTILKKELQKKTEGGDSLIQIFNHLYAKHENWIILPFLLNWKGETLSGTIRIKYSLFDRDFKKAIIQVNIKSDEIFFEIKKSDSNYMISIYCNTSSTRIKIKKNIMYLKSILQNLPVKIDDNIYKTEVFDGFSKVEDIINYHAINTVG